MVEGLKVRLSTEGLKRLLEERVEYHDTKEQWYSSQIENLKAGGLRPMVAATNDPVSSLETSKEQHKSKAVYFQFLADNLIPNEQYVLSNDDLLRLEIVNRFNW